MEVTLEELRPEPDLAMLGGTLAAAAGYLLPWFKEDPSYLWWHSGWGFASLSNGGGWTLMTFAWLAVAAVASLWAGRSLAAAMWALVGGTGAGVFALAVVAAAFSATPDRDSSNYITKLPFGVGLPLLAAGLGLLLAGGVRTIALQAAARAARDTRTDPAAGDEPPETASGP